MLFVDSEGSEGNTRYKQEGKRQLMFLLRQNANQHVSNFRKRIAYLWNHEQKCFGIQTKPCVFLAFSKMRIEKRAAIMNNKPSPRYSGNKVTCTEIHECWLTLSTRSSRQLAFQITWHFSSTQACTTTSIYVYGMMSVSSIVDRDDWCAVQARKLDERRRDGSPCLADMF